MPVTCKIMDKKWRIVQSDGAIEKTGKGTPVDGGGHESRMACMTQARAINRSVENFDEKTDVLLYGPILDTQELINEIRTKGDFTVRVNSRGGDVFESMPLYNAIKQHSSNTISIIEGSALSSASWVALAAKTVKMVENGVFMMHEPRTIFSGSIRDLQSRSDMINNSRNEIIKIYMDKSGKSKEEIETLLSNGTWLSAEQAKEHGFIDEIIPIHSQKETVSLDLTNFYDEAPSWVKNNLPSDTGEFRMKIEELATLYNLEGVNDLSEEDIVNKIAEKRKEESEKLTNLEKEMEALKKKPKEKEKKEKKASLPGYVINMAKKSRNAEIDMLFNDGYLTKAGADKQKAIWTSDDHLSNSFDEEGNETDSFEENIEAIRANGRVVNLGGGGSGIQRLAKQDDKEANVLVRNMESRNKETVN